MGDGDGEGRTCSRGRGRFEEGMTPMRTGRGGKQEVTRSRGGGGGGRGPGFSQPYLHIVQPGEAGASFAAHLEFPRAEPRWAPRKRRSVRPAVRDPLSP